MGEAWKWGDGEVVSSVASFMRRRREGDILFFFLSFFWLCYAVVGVLVVEVENR